MKELILKINFTWIAKCSLCIVCTFAVPSVNSQEPRIRCPYTHARFKNNKEAHVSIVPEMKIILVFRLVASLVKYVFRKQNMHLFIDLK